LSCRGGGVLRSTSVEDRDLLSGGAVAGFDGFGGVVEVNTATFQIRDIFVRDIR